MTAFLDTNLLIRHFTGDPPDLAERATRFLAGASELLLVDVVVAECVFVLQSFYEVERAYIAELMRAALALPAIRVLDSVLLLRALELYERGGLHFAEGYLVASAELSGVGKIASFDEAIDRVPSVSRTAP